jgi:hypothetical protein
MAPPRLLSTARGAGDAGGPIWSLWESIRALKGQEKPPERGSEACGACGRGIDLSRQEPGRAGASLGGSQCRACVFTAVASRCSAS